MQSFKLSVTVGYSIVVEVPGFNFFVLSLLFLNIELKNFFNADVLAFKLVIFLIYFQKIS